MPTFEEYLQTSPVKVEYIPDLPFLESIKRLSVTSDFLPDSIPDLPNCEELIIIPHAINKLFRLGKLPSCKKLIIHRSFLYIFEETYPVCEHFEVTHSRLTSLPFLPSVNFIKVNNNNLYKLPNLSVKTLHVQHNHLLHLPHLPNLVNGYFDHNRLINVNIDSSFLQNITLNNNPKLFLQVKSVCGLQLIYDNNRVIIPNNSKINLITITNSNGSRHVIME